jgi:clan AA aspartic protease (TIGR02281 family)
MLELAEGYAHGFTLMASGPIALRGPDTHIPPDKNESLRYYKLAADLGDDTAIRYMFKVYSFGGAVPKNKDIADHYLNEAAQYGHEWAILLIAQEEEKSAPQKALDAYLQLARNDNCIAQARLADAYSSGTLVKKNVTQAYFWLLLARVQRPNDNSDGRGWGYPASCMEAASKMISLLLAIDTHKVLSAKLMQVAEDAATNWTKGTVERLLPTPTIATASTASPKVQPKVATATTPSALPADQKSSSPMEVLLKQDGGIFVVPVEINGAMTLDFAVDSGASDVSIPADVFSTLLRTGTVKASDIIGEQTVELADGSQSKSPTFTIRSLKVGDKVIENVKATVAPVKGTLLLGQSFLGRFKSWSLDNTKHVLLLNP